jgi:hypothetical protein
VPDRLDSGRLAVDPGGTGHPDCSCPQAGQIVQAAIFGNLRKTLDSVSIWVETANPVLGHLIITEPIRALRSPQSRIQ